MRTLVGYNHVAGAAGNVVVPDLATNLGTVSKDGKTYTFHIKNGVKFGPPLNREITSKDILFAFERLGTPALIPGYAFYYEVIKGFKAFEAGTAKNISGITTPDPKTIVFKLTVPTGDFRYRLGMPATGPIPQEVAGCFTAPNEYGRYVISSGPYMLAGSDKLDATSCDTIKAAGGISGFDGTTNLDLVRNPDYNKATDSPKARENLPDSFTFTVNSNNDDIFAKVDRGDLEDEVSGGTVPPGIARQYKGSKQLKINSGDRTWYLMLNLTTPPFDDVHVRRAVNFVINREGMRKAWGGPLTGELARHIAPDAILGNTIKNFDPYNVNKTGGKGDLAAAKAEIKLSKYDTNHDGVCDAKRLQEPLHRHGRTRPGGGVPAGPRAEPEGHRHHAQGSGPEGRVHPDRRAAQEHRVLDPPGLGQGLLRPLRVLRCQLRRPHADPGGQHQPRSRRHHGCTGQEARRQGQRVRRSEREQGPRRLSADPRRRALLVLRRARQEDLHLGRSVGAVAVGQLRQPDLEERHQVGLRPVLRDHRVRPRGGQVI